MCSDFVSYSGGTIAAPPLIAPVDGLDDGYIDLVVVDSSL